jgi:transposase
MEKSRKIYDTAFKVNAVKLSYERNNLSAYAKELGITSAQLYRWRKEYNEYGPGSFPGNGSLKQTEEQKIIAKLQKQLKEKDLEHEILKKAISIISKNDR